MNKIAAIAVTILIAGTIGMASGFVIAKSVYPPVQILVSDTKTVIGEEMAYPEGIPKITAAIVTMQVGQTTGWHKHDAPLFAWVLEGEVTVDYGEHGIRTYTEGDAFLEAFASYHNGENTGDDFARILAVFAGAEGTDNTSMRDN